MAAQTGEKGTDDDAGIIGDQPPQQHRLPDDLLLKENLKNDEEASLRSTRRARQRCVR